MTITKTIVIDVDADKAADALKEVTKEVDELADSVEDVGKEAQESVDSTTKLKKGLKGVGTAVKGVGTALKAAGIGLIIALFAKLAEILGRNQKVLDIFTTAMTVVELVFKDLFNFVINNFMPAMEAMQKFFNDFSWESFTNGISNTFNWLGRLARMAGAVLSGDFATAAIIGAELFGGLAETVEKGALAFADYFVNVKRVAVEMTELNKQALLAESINRGLIEQYDRQAEQLRQIRDDDMRLIEDRIEANKRLGEVLNEQEKLMLGNAELTIQAARNQLALNNNIENQIALQDALNEKAGIQAQIEGFRSEQLVNQNSLLRERAEIDKEYFDEINELMEADLEESEKNFLAKEEADRKAANDKLKLAEDTQGFETALAGQTSNLIGQIVDEDSKAGKAFAIASAGISGIESVQNAFSTAQKSPITALNPAYPFIQAGLAGAFSLLQLNKIKSSDPTGKSGGGSTGGGTTAPSFNLVQGTGTNQIAEGLQTTLKPVRAFVVSSDVSTSQELDRKIVEGASL